MADLQELERQWQEMMRRRRRLQRQLECLDKEIATVLKQIEDYAITEK